MIVKIERFIKWLFFKIIMRVNIAVSGDTHGREDILFEVLKEWERKNKKKIDELYATCRSVL